MDNCQSSGIISKAGNEQTLVYAGRGLFYGIAGSATNAGALATVHNAATAASYSGTLILAHKEKNADYDDIDVLPSAPIAFSLGLVLNSTNCDVVIYYTKLP